MSLTIDYLPAAYRDRVARARLRRERLLMLIPLILALTATDQILRTRVRLARTVSAQAESRAIQGEQRAEQTRQLARRVATAKQQIEAWIAPLAAPRMTAVLDELLADQPVGMAIQELTCRHEPWGTSPAPTLRLIASTPSAEDFTDYTTALRETGALPELACPRTFRVGEDDRFGFQLETRTGGETRR